MNRIRIAAIFGTLSLVVYFFVVSIAAILAKESTFHHALMVPLALLEDLFSESFDGLAIARNLPVVCSLWLSFICIVDLSVLLASIKLEDLTRVLTFGNSYTKRLLTGLHLIES